jgi:hypothetical protein
VIVGASLAGALLAACGGSGDDTAGRASTTTTTTVAAPTTTRDAAPTTVPVSHLDVVTVPWLLPAPTSRAVVLADDGVLVLLGGQDAAHQSVAAVYRIDPVHGSATPASPLDPAVHDAAGVQRATDSVVIAGGTPPARATVQAASAGQATRTLGELPAPRTDEVAALVDGTIFVLGGADAAEVTLASVVRSTDGAAWADAGTLVEAVRYPAVATVDGAIFLFGGAREDGPDTTVVQRYDPASATTTVVAQLPAPLSHATAVVLGDQVWVLGGFVDDTPSTQILRFDAGTSTVTPAGSLPAPVTDAGAAATGPTTGYLLGGEGPGRSTSASVVELHAR